MDLWKPEAGNTKSGSQERRSRMSENERSSFIMMAITDMFEAEPGVRDKLRENDTDGLNYKRLQMHLGSVIESMTSAPGAIDRDAILEKLRQEAIRIGKAITKE